MIKFISLSVFVVLVVGGGSFIGIFTAPGEWYRSLEKPFFNPPNWIFGPVWTLLYVFIAVAGWRLWNGARSSASMKLWFVQIAINFAWSPVFFAAQQTGFAFVVIVALLITIISFIRKTWNVDRTAAGLFIPYAAWVAFATLLNGSLLYLNGPS